MYWEIHLNYLILLNSGSCSRAYLTNTRSPMSLAPLCQGGRWPSMLTSSPSSVRFSGWPAWTQPTYKWPHLWSSTKSWPAPSPSSWWNRSGGPALAPHLAEAGGSLPGGRGNRPHLLSAARPHWGMAPSPACPTCQPPTASETILHFSLAALGPLQPGTCSSSRPPSPWEWPSRTRPSSIWRGHHWRPGQMRLWCWLSPS